MNKSDIDWFPCLNLGHEKVNTIVWEKFTIEYFHMKIVRVKIFSSFKAVEEKF